MKQRGITLITLVVTIVVLLILAGVSIAMVLGQEGITAKAKISAEETRGSQVEEAKNMWKLEQKTEELTNGQQTKTVEQLISELVGQGLLTEKEQDIIVGNPDKGIVATGKITIGSRTIIFIEQNAISSWLYIGDYVDYKPQEGVAAYDLITNETYSGSSKNVAMTQEPLTWRVFNINETQKTVDLIGTTTNQVVYLSGARGDNNGVYLLNDLCNYLYKNDNIGATARSLNIEDVQNKIENKNSYENFTNKAGVTYNASSPYHYATPNYVPLNWDKGITGESDNKTLVSYTDEKEARIENKESTDLIQTYYDSGNIPLSSSFKKAKTRLGEDDYIYYNLLFNNGTGKAWIASRFVNIFEEYADFGIRSSNVGFLGGTYLYNS